MAVFLKKLADLVDQRVDGTLAGNTAALQAQITALENKLAVAQGTIACIVTGCSTPPSPVCTFITSYPGDDASQVDTASWMAGRATEAGIPAELPIMAALVDSGLKNLDYGDSDSVAFFQMRLGIWNQGKYDGFPDNPELQIQWFIDQARAVRAARIAAGDAAFGSDPLQWGEWVADVQRPPEQFRGRYQQRLGDARQLIELACGH
jgi:hypothetical protein